MSYRNAVIRSTEFIWGGTSVLDYMSDEEIACLRLSADVFVHAQVSDALCTTIQEYCTGILS